MIRLHVVVEGQTEETFVRDVLALELANHDIFATAHRITTARKHGRIFRGGLMEYVHLREDLILWMKQDQKREARFTTMVDLYGLPRDFPGFDDSRLIRDPRARAEFLETKLRADIDDWRFIPYVQVHEFEALLFCDPSVLAVAFPAANSQIEKLIDMSKTVEGPELINDETAPSKHITALLPDYAKSVHGPIAVSLIGLSKLREKCSHFDKWCRAILDLSLEPPN